MSDLPLCKCGCGIHVEKKSRKYFGDHYRNPVGPPQSEFSAIDAEAIEEELEVEEIEEKKIPEVVNVTVKTKPPHKAKVVNIEIPIPAEKRKTIPLRGGKVSKNNLRNVGLGIYTC